MRLFLHVIGSCLAIALVGCTPQRHAAVAPLPSLGTGDTTGLTRLLEQLDRSAVRQPGVDSVIVELERVLQSVDDSAFTNLLNRNGAAVDSLWQLLQHAQSDSTLMEGLLHQNSAALDSLWESLRCRATPTRPPRAEPAPLPPGLVRP